MRVRISPSLGGLAPLLYNNETPGLRSTTGVAIRQKRKGEGGAGPPVPWTPKRGGVGAPCLKAKGLTIHGKRWFRGSPNPHPPSSCRVHAFSHALFQARLGRSMVPLPFRLCTPGSPVASRGGMGQASASVYLPMNPLYFRWKE